LSSGSIRCGRECEIGIGTSNLCFPAVGIDLIVPIECPCPNKGVCGTRLKVVWNGETSSTSGFVLIAAELWAILEPNVLIRSSILGEGFDQCQITNCGIRCWIGLRNPDVEPIVWDVGIVTGGGDVILGGPCNANVLSRSVLSHWPLCIVSIGQGLRCIVLADWRVCQEVVSVVKTEDAPWIPQVLPVSAPGFAIVLIEDLCVTILSNVIVSASKPGMSQCNTEEGN